MRQNAAIVLQLPCSCLLETEICKIYVHVREVFISLSPRTIRIHRPFFWPISTLNIPHIGLIISFVGQWSYRYIQWSNTVCGYKFEPHFYFRDYCSYYSNLNVVFCLTCILPTFLAKKCSVQCGYFGALAQWI